MKDPARTLRREFAKRERGHGKRFPEALKRRVIAWALEPSALRGNEGHFRRLAVPSAPRIVVPPDPPSVLIQVQAVCGGGASAKEIEPGRIPKLNAACACHPMSRRSAERPRWAPTRTPE